MFNYSSLFFGYFASKQVVNLQAELSYMQAHLASLEVPSPPQLPPTLITPPPLTIADLPSSSTMPATYDLSSLFEPMVQPWTTVQHRPVLDLRQFVGSGGGDTTSSSSSGVGGGDLQALARELLHIHGTTSIPNSDVSPSLSPSK